MGDNIQMYVDDNGHLQYTSAMTTMAVNPAGHLLYSGTIAPIITEYIVDLSSNNNYVQVPVMQGDGAAARFAKITLIANGTVFDCTGLFATIAGSKPDGTQIMDSCTILDDNTILVEITQQMSSVAGRGEYCITLFQGEQNTAVKSFPFYVLVTRSPYNVSEVVSSNEFTALSDMMSKALSDYDRVMEATQDDRTAVAAYAATVSTQASQVAENTQSVATNTQTVATNTQTCVTKAATAAVSEANAKDYADLSKSYAVGTNGQVRANDSVDNAEYYYERSKALVQGLGGVWIPMGSCRFSDLVLAGQLPGFAYNITEAFVTTADFKEGAGIQMPAGTNIFVTGDMKWDTFVGTTVTGIKGDAELNYRTGNVNITPAQLGVKYTSSSSTVPTDALAEYWEVDY